jgi:alkanesulfonate monooxygenase SsuD/methylene tetrahydromethanopterin reductase-like flavin-dependent oxidoreductase (luciferase family)
METGVVLGRELGLSEEDRTGLVGEAAELGYTSAWTNSGPDLAGVETCRRWFDASGLTTGIAVVPTPGMDLAPLVRAARALGEASNGRFILGIGAGGMSSAAWRAEHGLAETSPVALMREHTELLKREAAVPVYLAALGPRMLELAGELADGVLPNWLNPPQLAWARERIGEGARRAGRDPGAVLLGQSIRVCIDDDVAAARRALARSAIGYALPRPGHAWVGPYRQAMARMGLEEDLKMLDGMRDRGADDDELAEAFPADALRRLGAWGRPAEAVAGFAGLAQNLDIILVRVVTARPGLEAARAIIRACAPGRST